MLRKHFSLSWRRNRRSPAWWCAVLLIGLSSGATVAIAVAYRSIVLHPLPTHRSAEIVGFGGLAFGAGMPDPVEWWGSAPGLEHISLYRVGDIKVECPGAATRWVRLAEVSGGFFDIFAGSVVQGRPIGRDDELRDVRAAVISAGLAREVLGDVAFQRPVECRLGGIPYALVGSVSAAMTFPSNAHVWVPRAAHEARRPVLVNGAEGLPPARNQTGWVGMPKPGVTAEQLEEQMRALLAAANGQLSPKTGIRYGNFVAARLLVPGLTETVRPAMIVLLASTLVVLILAICNGVVLSVVRASDRQREFALKLSLGATYGEVTREVVVESMTLALASMVLAMGTAVGFLTLARQFLFGYRAYLPEVEVLWFATALLSLTAGVVVGIASTLPSLVISRRAATSLLASRASESNAKAIAGMARKSFVALSAAVATVLLAGALVADRSLGVLLNQDLGYQDDGVLVTQVALQRATLGGTSFHNRRQEILAMAKQAGLQSPAFGSGLPVLSSQRGFQRVGSTERKVMAAVTQVDGPYFELLDIPVTGAGFSGKADEIVVSTALAAALSPGTSILGATLSFDGTTVPLTVVGIAADTRTVDQDPQPVMEVYRSFGDVDAAVMPSSMIPLDVLGRCAGDCRDEVDRVIDGLRPLAGTLIIRVEELSASIASARGNSTVAASIWTLYGTLSVGIALFAVIAMANHSVARRRREVGIRTALGASPGRVTSMFVFEIVVAVAAGTATGVAATFYSTAALQTLVAGLHMPSILELGAAAAVVFFVAPIAAALSVRPITRQTAASLLRASGGD